LELTVQGFDEFMNVVIDEAEEVYDCSAKPGKDVKPKRDLGKFYPSVVHGRGTCVVSRCCATRKLSSMAYRVQMAKKDDIEVRRRVG
jgi:hypothetical protein